MALDTYLVVFHHFDTQSLRRLEIKYIGVITTLSFIPAFVFLFIPGHYKGPIYGDETVSSLNRLDQHMLKLIYISIDLVLGISQLDATPHNILLCTRMVRVLPPAPPGNSTNNSCITG
jgi:hypothetical protein